MRGSDGWHMILAAGLTVITFLALPYAGIAKRPSRPDMLLRPVRRVRLPSPQEIAPPPTPRKVPPRVAPAPIALRQNAHPLRLVPEFDLNPVAPASAVDFGLDFTASPELAVGSGGPFEVEQVDRGPQPLAQLAPIYPVQARMRKIEGSVDVVYTVTENGVTKDVEIMSGEPRGVFERSARRAVRRWHFKPAILNGQPVAVRVRQTIRFELQGKRGGRR